MTQLVHLHIPKAGGSTFNKCLDHYFVGSIGRVRGHFNYSYDIAVEGGPHQALVGHFDMRGVVESFPDPEQVEVVCFLRNPFDRVISGYFNVLRDPSNPAHEAVKDMDLPTYVCSEAMPDIDNGQVRRLSTAGARKDEDRPVGPKQLEEALELIQTYDIKIGFSEEFDRSLLTIARKLGWRRPRYLTVNRGKNRDDVADRDFMAQVYDLIARRNQADLALYQYAWQRRTLDPPIGRAEHVALRANNRWHYMSNVPNMARFKLNKRRRH